MAKSAVTGEMPTSITEGKLSGAHRRTLATLKRSVLDAARAFGTVRERLTDLAPKITKLYNGIVAENERFTFVEFARMFDPSVPTHAADRDGTTGYRNHRVYYTLAYMRRLVQTASTGRRGQQGVRDSATDGFARTIATVLQLVKDPETVWTAIQSEFDYSERLMTRLRKRVAETQPIIKLVSTSPAKIGPVVHMTPVVATTSENAMRSPGKHVTLPEAPTARRSARSNVA